jgi:hypothetical protein
LGNIKVWYAFGMIGDMSFAGDFDMQFTSLTEIYDTGESREAQHRRSSGIDD